MKLLPTATSKYISVSLCCFGSSDQLLSEFIKRSPCELLEGMGQGRGTPVAILLAQTVVPRVARRKAGSLC